MQTRKLIIVSAICTGVLAIGFGYSYYDKKRKEELVNKKITSLDDALKLLEENHNPNPPIDDTIPYDMDASERYGTTEYGVSAEYNAPIEY
jgi:hypothetical protein